MNITKENAKMGNNMSSYNSRTFMVNRGQVALGKLNKEHRVLGYDLMQRPSH